MQFTGTESNWFFPTSATWLLFNTTSATAFNRDIDKSAHPAQPLPIQRGVKEVLRPPTSRHLFLFIFNFNNMQHRHWSSNDPDIDTARRQSLVSIQTDQPPGVRQFTSNPATPRLRSASDSDPAYDILVGNLRHTV